MHRVIGYVRCSTEEQKRSGLGLDAQHTAIAQEAERRGWEVVWITDNGSGKNMKRKGMKQARAMLKSAEAGGIIVAKLDRLSRSVFDFADLMRDAQSEGWAVVALDLGVDTSTPNGKLVANMMMSVAEWERERIAERTRDALSVARDRGVRLGGRRCVPDPVRRRIVAMRSEGATLTAIANTLTEEDVPTGKGGARWYPSTVAALLKTERVSAA